MRARFLMAFALSALVAGSGCGGSTVPEDPNMVDQDSSTTGDDTSTTGGDSSVSPEDSTVTPEDTTSPDPDAPMPPDAPPPDAPPPDGATDTPTPVDAPCSAPKVTCPSGCADLTSDPVNCGACGTRCAVGQSCITTGGATACACPTGKRICGFGSAATCADTMTDNRNCGMCGNVCASAETCTAGVCKCNAGATMCGTRCVDLKTDVLNCNTCGFRCPFGSACVAGACTCPEGMKTLCSSFGGSQQCTDTTEDPNHCGMCGNNCQNSEACDGAGKCACRPGLTACASMGMTFCRDTKFDPRACGACGTACTGTQICDGGTCKAGPTCSAGLTSCPVGGTTARACVDLKTSPLSCGACGNACQQYEVCVPTGSTTGATGACRNYRPSGSATCSATACGPGTTCCPKFVAGATFAICVEGGVCPP